MQLVRLIVATGCTVVTVVSLLCGEDLPDARPVPLMQIVPQPYAQASVERDGRELTRFHYGASLRRPFLFPVVGPAGRSLTRMGHPHDAVGHSHHNSIWITHHDVDGVDFWGDRGDGKIVYRPLVRDAYHDGDEAAVIRARFDWIDEKSGDKVLLQERRQVTVMPLDENEWLLLLDLELTPAGEQVAFGKTPFGLVGVRMAKTIGVHDGGGRILNSAGGRDEKEILWKHAKWVDYSGPIATGVRGGITLMDHPGNVNFPSGFHVRNDGWMGASLTLDDALVVKKDAPLRLRYGLHIHAGVPTVDEANEQFTAFGKLPRPDWSKAWK